MGNSLVDSLSQPFTALQTALSACHNPEKYNLVFIISSDGSQNQVYLGICSQDSLDSSSEEFIGNIGKFLQGNWQGTKFRELDTDSTEVKTFNLTIDWPDLELKIPPSGVTASGAIASEILARESNIKQVEI